MRFINNNTDKNKVYNRIAHGAFWSFTGTATAKFLTLLSGIICAHILTRHNYGEFSMIRSTINMFVVLGAGGIGVTVTKHISEHKKNNKSTIPYIYANIKRFGLFTGAFCTLVVLIFSEFISSSILSDSSLSIPLKWGSLLLFFSIVNGVQNGTLLGFEDFRSIAVNTLTGSVFETIFMLVGAWLYGVSGAILGFGLGFVVIFLMNKLSIKKQFTRNGLSFVSSSNIQNKYKLITSFTLPATLSALLIAPTFWLLRSLLANKNGFEELAVFEAADQWKVVMLFIPTTISQIALPILSSLSGEKRVFINTLWINVGIVAAVSIALMSIVLLIGNDIMRLYGSSFANPQPIRILSISCIFSAVANVLELSVYSIGKMWQCFYLNVLWAASAIGLTIIFLDHGLGASGVAYAICISYIFSCILFAGYVCYLNSKNAFGK